MLLEGLTSCEMSKCVGLTVTTSELALAVEMSLCIDAVLTDSREPEDCEDNLLGSTGVVLAFLL